MEALPLSEEDTVLWLVLVLLTINLGIATIWFTYALLIETRFRDNLFPRSWWSRHVLGQLFLHAKSSLDLRQAVLERAWDRLEPCGLTEVEKKFLMGCSQEQLNLRISIASQAVASNERATS